MVIKYEQTITQLIYLKRINERKTLTLVSNLLMGCKQIRLVVQLFTGRTCVIYVTTTRCVDDTNEKATVGSVRPTVNNEVT